MSVAGTKQILQKMARYSNTPLEDCVNVQAIPASVLGSGVGILMEEGLPVPFNLYQAASPYLK